MYNDQDTFFGDITQSLGMSGWDGDPNRDLLEAQYLDDSLPAGAHRGATHRRYGFCEENPLLAMPMLIAIFAAIISTF